MCKRDSCEDIVNCCFEATCTNGEWQIEERSNVTEWEKRSNACFEYICDNHTGAISRKRENAREWEQQTNACIEYQCNNESGYVAWSMCNSTNNATRICINSRCIEEEESEENKVKVDIELENGLNLTEWNSNEFLNILNVQLEINTSDTVIGWESNEQGHIIHVILYVNDEATANRIADAARRCTESDESTMRMSKKRKAEKQK